MGFNLGFKGLMTQHLSHELLTQIRSSTGNPLKDKCIVTWMQEFFRVYRALLWSHFV